jgi:hypothetical protein
MESDWRTFRDMVPKLRERYLADCNAWLADLLNDSKQNETERFWGALRKMEHEAKVLRRCLDGHSPSTMQQYMEMMIYSGMLKKEDMAVFSEELQKQVSFLFEEVRR